MVLFEKLVLSSLDPLYRALYALTKDQNAGLKGMSRIRAGHFFEDATSQLVYSHARECGLKAHPARQTLKIPTRSGNSYQFDASFSQGGTVYFVERKRRNIPCPGQKRWPDKSLLQETLTTAHVMLLREA